MPARIRRLSKSMLVQAASVACALAVLGGVYVEDGYGVVHLRACLLTPIVSVE